MKKSRLTNLTDYLALIVRHRWWVIGTTVALCGLTLLITLLMPESFTSRTMILIQQRDVPSDFVKDLIGGSTDERLSSIEQTILSRTNLLRILSEFGDRMLEFRDLNDERKVQKLQSRIQIEFPSERRQGRFIPTTNILISYRDRNPEMAQRITGRLAALFIEQDSRARESKVFGTAEFLETELQKVAAQLRQSEDTLKILKQRNRYEMPSERETNLRTLDRLQLQKIGNLEAVDRYVTQQMNLEKQISETSPTITISPPAVTEPPRPPNPLVETYRRKEQEYIELSAKAKPDHPDVRRLKAELDQLKKDIPPEDLTVGGNTQPVPAPASQPNPVYQSLTAQLRQLKTDIEIREREKQWIENEMAKYDQRVQSAPRVEQEMAAIARTNEELNRQYEDLKTKLEEARLAGSLESRQKGEQFAIIDAANYPMEPSSPSPLILFMAGFIVSIAGGVAVAIVVNMVNQKVWTHRELERALEAPVLVEIPSISTPAEARSALRRKLAHVLVFLLISVFYLGGIYYMYERQSSVMRLLDPIIERIAERAAK